MFNLPDGYTAQVLWHRDVGNTCFELHKVYSPEGHLDVDRSFWLVTPLDQEAPTVMGQVSYGALKSSLGRDAGTFDDFTSPSQPPARIYDWLRRASVQA